MCVCTVIGLGWLCCDVWLLYFQAYSSPFVLVLSWLLMHYRDGVLTSCRFAFNITGVEVPVAPGLGQVRAPIAPGPGQVRAPVAPGPGHIRGTCCTRSRSC